MDAAASCRAHAQRGCPFPEVGQLAARRQSITSKCCSRACAPVDQRASSLAAFSVMVRCQVLGACWQGRSSQIQGAHAGGAASSRAGWRHSRFGGRCRCRRPARCRSTAHNPTQLAALPAASPQLGTMMQRLAKEAAKVRAGEGSGGAPRRPGAWPAACGAPDARGTVRESSTARPGGSRRPAATTATLARTLTPGSPSAAAGRSCRLAAAGRGRSAALAAPCPHTARPAAPLLAPAQLQVARRSFHTSRATRGGHADYEHREHMYELWSESLGAAPPPPASPARRSLLHRHETASGARARVPLNPPPSSSSPPLSPPSPQT